MRAIVAAWRPSLFAGFMGATASQFWFLAFALATAASVRTLALVEVLFAQAISSFVFGQRPRRAKALGIVLIVIGVVLLIWAALIPEGDNPALNKSAPVPAWPGAPEVSFLTR